MVSFIKMHGLGNDFVIIDLDQNQELSLTEDFVRLICDRKFGVGADQLITIINISNSAVKMGVFNNDASKSNACGNATRCISYYLYQKEKTKHHTIISEFGDKITTNYIKENIIESILPEPKFDWKDIPLAIEFNEFVNFFEYPNLPKGYFVNVGNPHVVFFVKSLDTINIDFYGKAIENHEYFPEKVNVNFAEIITNDSIKLRTFERGTGTTLACGTGAAASAVCGIKYIGLGNTVNVIQLGGELQVKYQNSNITTIGPAVKVFSGYFNLINN